LELPEHSCLKPAAEPGVEPASESGGWEQVQEVVAACSRAPAFCRTP